MMQNICQTITEQELMTSIENNEWRYCFDSQHVCSYHFMDQTTLRVRSMTDANVGGAFTRFTISKPEMMELVHKCLLENTDQIADLCNNARPGTAISLMFQTEKQIGEGFVKGKARVYPCHRMVVVLIRPMWANKEYWVPTVYPVIDEEASGVQETENAITAA